MTITIPVHRALSVKLAPRGFHVVTRWGCKSWSARVSSNSTNDQNIERSQPGLRFRSTSIIATRSYATKSAAKPASRPKAHTGRTPVKRTTKASTSSKPGPKTAAGKAAIGRKPKAKTEVKTKTKPTKAATKTKAAPKKPAVKKAPSATALTRQRRAKDRELREAALLTPPKKLPATPWTVLFSEANKGSHAFSASSELLKEAAQKLKNLVPEEKEHYNHLANQNKAANETAYKNWLSQYTPEQIRQANVARQQLKKQYKEKNPKAGTLKRFAPLKDDRLVSRPRASYVLFNVDRHATGDFAHMTIVEASKLIGREWKALDAGEKKKYEDRGQAETSRYIEEYTSVYGQAPKQSAKPTPKVK